MWFFFYIFKSHWEPHYNLVISRGKRNQISKRNLTSIKKMYFKGRRKINRMKVLQASKQLQIVGSNVSGSPIGSELLWGQIPITDPSVLLDGTGSVPQTTDQTDTWDRSMPPLRAGLCNPTPLTQPSTWKPFGSPHTSFPVPSVQHLIPERGTVHIFI